jgi:protein involved in polysaccharide export with SLBB domain
LRYLRLGDLDQNPVLRDGDVITVFPLDNTVSILGSVYMPGEYEYVEDDRLSDLLALAQGFTLEADRTNLNLYRYKDGLTDFDLIPLDLAATPATQVNLQPKDRVIVIQNTEQRRAWKFTVEGRVKAPGEYLIGESTTLYDILKECGGPSAIGDLRNALYVNGIRNAKADPEFERLKELSITQMTPMEYNYLRSRMRQTTGKYSVDIQAVWDSEGREGNVAVRDGDYLYVPENLDMVAVTGQVRYPGLVPWVEGKDWKYYIEAAGGYTNNRRLGGVRVIRSASGNWVKPTKKLPINPGDMVFVAEQTDRDVWTDVKDVVGLAAQIITIIIGITALTN